MVIWEEEKSNPTTLSDFVCCCTGEQSLTTNTKYISHLLKSWHWSFNYLQLKGINGGGWSLLMRHIFTVIILFHNCKEKFVNVLYLQQIDLWNCKVIGPPVHLGVNFGALNETFSVTPMTTLSVDQPIIFDIREKSNTQNDFLGFLCYLIKNSPNEEVWPCALVHLRSLHAWHHNRACGSL